jgi:hypothetical protein
VGSTRRLESREKKKGNIKCNQAKLSRKENESDRHLWFLVHRDKTSIKLLCEGEGKWGSGGGKSDDDRLLSMKEGNGAC